MASNFGSQDPFAPISHHRCGKFLSIVARSRHWLRGAKITLQFFHSRVVFINWSKSTVFEKNARIVKLSSVLLTLYLVDGCTWSNPLEFREWPLNLKHIVFQWVDWMYKRIRITLSTPSVRGSGVKWGIRADGGGICSPRTKSTFSDKHSSKKLTSSQNTEKCWRRRLVWLHNKSVFTVIIQNEIAWKLSFRYSVNIFGIEKSRKLWILIPKQLQKVYS